MSHTPWTARPSHRWKVCAIYATILLIFAIAPSTLKFPDDRRSNSALCFMTLNRFIFYRRELRHLSLSQCGNTRDRMFRSLGSHPHDAAAVSGIRRNLGVYNGACAGNRYRHIPPGVSASFNVSPSIRGSPHQL